MTTDMINLFRGLFLLRQVISCAVIILVRKIPDGAAILHERSRYVANLVDGIVEERHDVAAGGRLVGLHEEIIEILTISTAASAAIPHVADGADVVLEVRDGIVAVRRLHIEDVAGRERIGNLGSAHLVGNGSGRTLVVRENLSNSILQSLPLAHGQHSWQFRLPMPPAIGMCAPSAVCTPAEHTAVPWHRSHL